MIDDPVCSPIGEPAGAEALAHNAGNQATGGIWRVTGAAGTAILKHATPGGDGGGHWRSSDDPAHWNYWRRELLAYRDGLADEYCADTGLAAPRLLAAAERPDGSMELWLEDVTGTPGQDWSVDRLGGFAHQLGLAQVRFRADRHGGPPWLSRRWLRQYAGRFTVDGPLDWRHPLLARHWPDELCEGLRTLWDRRTDLFDIAERLPGTLCHLDVWPKNFIARGAESVLLDWAFVGWGAIGEDIGNLIPDTVADGLMDNALLPDITEAAIGGYLAGLRAGGWHGDDADVRYAVAVTGAAKYVWLAPMMVARLARGQYIGSANYDAGDDEAAILRRRRPMYELLVTWARQALDG